MNKLTDNELITIWHAFVEAKDSLEVGKRPKQIFEHDELQSYALVHQTIYNELVKRNIDFMDVDWCDTRIDLEANK